MPPVAAPWWRPAAAAPRRLPRYWSSALGRLLHEPFDDLFQFRRDVLHQIVDRRRLLVLMRHHLLDGTAFGEGIAAGQEVVQDAAEAVLVAGGGAVVGSMMLSGLAQSRPLVSVLAVDIVSTSDSPSFSASKEPMPKSRMWT